MSVAFRREGDDEHLEPKFELPIPPGPNLVTARGLALIRKKVAELQTAIGEAQDEIRIAALKRDLRYWETRQATAELVPPAQGDEVAFGTRVTFRVGDKVRTIDIVGDDEADPGAGRLSFSSPLARAMIGAEEDDLVDFNGREEAIALIRVEPIGDNLD